MREDWKKTTVYQIYPKSFKDSNGDGIGDIAGIIEKLDYLQELGIGAIWLTPMYCSPQVDNGYDISDYYHMDEMFGTNEEFMDLLHQAHERDIKIIMDIVINHTSTEHMWFQKAFVEKDEKYRNYYIVREGKNEREPNNWMSFFGGSAWEKIEGENAYYLHLFAKEQADLNWECEELRREVKEMMKYWLSVGVDGFRLDVINLVSKDPNFPDDCNPMSTPGKRYYINGPRIHEYLKEVNQEVFSPYQALTVGETMDGLVEDGVVFTKAENKELDMIFSMEHLEVDYKHGDRWTVQETDFIKLKEILSKWQERLEEAGGWNSLFWSNHDQPRAVSRFGDEGKYRIESGKMLATILHLLKGTPYIYQGEEFGMPNPGYDRIEDYTDIESWHIYTDRLHKGFTPEEIMPGIHRQSRDNARSPMQWNAQENGGFTHGTPWMKVGKSYQRINAEEDKKNPNGLFQYYQKLIKLRKTEPLVVDGSYRCLVKQHPDVWCYLRVGKEGALLVIANFYGKKTTFNIPDEVFQQYEIKELILSNYERDLPDKELHLREYETVVYKCKYKQEI